MAALAHGGVGADDRATHVATVRANDGGQAAPREMGYRGCLRAIRLAERYSHARMEAAAERALLTGACRYRSTSPSEELARPASDPTLFGAAHTTSSRQHPRCGVLRIRSQNMLHEPTMQKLVAMRLHGMADALKTQQQDPAARELSFLERLALLVDHQWNWRQNQALVRRLDLAKLRGNICVPARARPLTNIDASNHMTELARQTVGAIGVPQNESSKWQQLAYKPDKEFEAGLGRSIRLRGGIRGRLSLLFGDRLVFCNRLVHRVTAVAGNRHAEVMAGDADSENSTA